MRAGAVDDLPFYHSMSRDIPINELEERREIQEQQLLFDQMVLETDDLGSLTPTGSKSLRKLKEMNEIKLALGTAGWLDNCSDEDPSTDIKDYFQIGKDRPKSYWHNLLQHMREMRMATLAKFLLLSLKRNRIMVDTFQIKLNY
jgi:hypothetical protein